MLADLACEDIPEGAEVLGMHLEGPFINIDKKGAHPAEHVAPAGVTLLDDLLEIGPVRMLTIAPELEGAVEPAKTAAGHGIVVSADTRTPRSSSPTGPSRARSRA